MPKKEKKKKDTLDTQTTIADMNVEGIRGYDPSRKNREQKERIKLTKKEQKALIRGAYKAMLPMILCMAVAFLGMFLLAMLWLR